MLTALAGGVGAARFLDGLVAIVPPDEVTTIVNTGDDDEFHGLWVSPDLDSVTYRLAGAHNPETGWGLAEETFHTMGALARYGAPTWFNLGDRDLATHLYRTQRRNQGASLTEVTAEITAAWGLECRLLPMTDDRVATRITVSTGDRHGGAARCRSGSCTGAPSHPSLAVRFDGAEIARPAPGVLEALEAADTIVVCPSNPVISIGPILAVPGIREVLVARRDRVVGVSPIIAGRPVRGPADRLMGPLGIEVSCVGVARAYREFCSTLVIDGADAVLAPQVEALGVRAVVADTVMRDARCRGGARPQHPCRGRVTLSIHPIAGVPEIRPGDELAEVLADAAAAQGTPLVDGDCLVVTQKVVSKAEDRLVPLDPDDEDARRRLIESESVRILRRRGELIISETHARVRVRQRGDRPVERPRRGRRAAAGRRGPLGPARPRGASCPAAAWRSPS